MTWTTSTATNTARELGLKTLENFQRTWERNVIKGRTVRSAVAEAMHLAGPDATAKEVLIFMPLDLRRKQRRIQQLMEELRN